MTAANGRQAPWRATVLSLFPDLFPGPLGVSVPGKALAAGLWSLDAVDLRDFAGKEDRRVDDLPFGGGPGMVMRADVVDAALTQVRGGAVDARGPTLYLSPRGRPLAQPFARDLAAGPGVTLMCGRYEGVDQRALDAWQVTEVSLGDFVLSGGEIAAMALLEATVRLLPGVVGAAASLADESFEHGLLEYPHYTRPANWTDRRGVTWSVPDVLVSGHHGRIAEWRRDLAETTTRRRRPDLWRRYRAAKNKEGLET